MKMFLKVINKVFLVAFLNTQRYQFLEKICDENPISPPKLYNLYEYTLFYHYKISHQSFFNCYHTRSITISHNQIKLI